MKKIYKKWWVTFIKGLLCLTTGVFFVLNPEYSTLWINYIFAFILLFFATNCFFKTIILEKNLFSKILKIFSSLILLLLFFFISIYHISGTKILTCLMIAFLCFDGIFKLFFIDFYKWYYTKSWIIFSGFLSLFLGLILMMSLPESSKYSLGLFFGAGLIGVGISLLFNAYELKEAEKIFINQ